MTTPVAETPATVLTVVEWRRAERHHHQLVERLVAPHDARRAAGELHPVEDFLFTYYRLRSSQLRQWHPGAGIGLLDATTDQFRKFYRRNDDSVTSVDVAAFTAAHADTA
ncbi:MAG: 3-methyladenine glycosylase, partial [Acidimicrobiales bacterium]|nr:3-methyladenine glycosylase [Acidimicrobiales bacterium]